MLHFAEVELLPGASLEDVQDVQAGRLEVRGGVVGLGDEQLVGSPVICRLKCVSHLRGKENVENSNERRLPG